MTAEADSPEASSDIMSVIGPKSPLKLDLYHNVSTRGCNKRCPCRTWLNCHYYNGSRWKKLRGNEELLWEDIHTWYETFFKYRPEMPESNMNA